MSAPSFAAVLLLAGTAVLAVGWIGAFFFRRRAAWENALWRTVLLVLLVLPVAQLVGPYVARAPRPEEVRHEKTASLVEMKGSGLAGETVKTPPVAPPGVSNVWPMVWRSLLWTWAAGAVGSLAGLARSVWKVRRWVRGASRITDGEGCEALMDGARTAGVRPPELCVASGLYSPVLVGWRRPRILVPSPEVARQREVLLHELAHLRRADLWWMTLGRVVSAGWWFHPLAWGVGRRLERSAEDVCDDLVVSWTRDAAAYAGQLMRFVRPVGAAGWQSAAGTAITGFRSELGKRVERVLEPGRTLRVEVGRGGVASLAAGAALLLAVLAAASPSRGQGTAPTTRPPTAAGAEKPAGSTPDAAALAAMNQKLTDIVVPHVEFRRTTVRDGLEFLRQEAQRLDQTPDHGKRGVDISLAVPLSAEEADRNRLNVVLNNVPLIEVLRQVARQAGMRVVVGPRTVVLVSASPGNGAAAGAVSPAPSAEALATEKTKQADLQAKLTGLVVPSIEFRDTRVSDAIEFLRQEAQRLDKAPDQDKRGVNIVLAVPPVSPVKRVSLSLNQVPLLEALVHLADQANLKVVVGPYAVTVEPKDP